MINSGMVEVIEVNAHEMFRSKYYRK
jgi:hypothetical protein